MDRLHFYNAIVKEVGAGEDFGKLKVVCPELFSDQTTEFIEAWNIQLTALGGSFVCPQVNDQVSIVALDENNEFCFWTYPILDFSKAKDFLKENKTYTICYGKNQVILSEDKILIIDTKNSVSVLISEGKLTLKNNNCEFILDAKFGMKTPITNLNEVFKAIVDLFYNMPMPVPAVGTPTLFSALPANQVLVDLTKNKIDGLCTS